MLIDNQISSVKIPEEIEGILNHFQSLLDYSFNPQTLTELLIHHYLFSYKNDTKQVTLDSFVSYVTNLLNVNQQEKFDIFLSFYQKIDLILRDADYRFVEGDNIIISKTNLNLNP